MEKKNEYEDMLFLPHPVSTVHPPMTRQNRAAQFAPFAALTGYSDAVRETARRTEARVELDENVKAVLDRKLQLLKESLGKGPEIVVTYFVPDLKKAGGAYVTAKGRIRKLDPYGRRIVLEDGTEIFMERITALESELFGALEE